VSPHRGTAFPTSNDVVARRLRRVPRWADNRHSGAFHQEREITGEVETFKLGAGEAVDQRVQQTVHVGEHHEAVEGHGGFILPGLGPRFDPGDQQHHSGHGAGEEAEGEDHHDGGHQEHRPPQLGLVPDGLLPEPVDDVHRAVDEDDEGDDDLGEEDHFPQTVHHVL